MGHKTGTVRHVHQYYRRDDGLWACNGYEDCTHYMPKNMLPAPVGRRSRCWSCQEPFQLTFENMKKSNKPVCDDCASELGAIEEFINLKTPEKPEILRRYGLKLKDEIEIIEPDEEE